MEKQHYILMCFCVQETFNVPLLGADDATEPLPINFGAPPSSGFASGLKLPKPLNPPIGLDAKSSAGLSADFPKPPPLAKIPPPLPNRPSAGGTVPSLAGVNPSPNRVLGAGADGLAGVEVAAVDGIRNVVLFDAIVVESVCCGGVFSSAAGNAFRIDSTMN